MKLTPESGLLLAVVVERGANNSKCQDRECEVCVYMCVCVYALVCRGRERGQLCECVCKYEFVSTCVYLYMSVWHSVCVMPNVSIPEPPSVPCVPPPPCGAACFRSPAAPHRRPAGTGQICQRTHPAAFCHPPRQSASLPEHTKIGHDKRRKKELVRKRLTIFTYSQAGLQINNLTSSILQYYTL